MTKFLTLMVILIGSGQLANASELPMVSNVGVEIDRGPMLATVQPTATIKFTIASCEARNLSLSTEKEDQTVYITIIDLDADDCRGIPLEREYQLQVSSDATRENYVILNPIAPTYK